MKVLVATEKPFAAIAVDGIREVIENAGYELELLEKYSSKEELLAEKKDIVLDFAMKKQFAVIVDGNPIEYSAFQIDGDAVMADMLLDEDEAAVVQDGRIRFVRSV